MLDSSLKAPKQESLAQTLRSKMDTPDCPDAKCADPALTTVGRGRDARATPGDKDRKARDPAPAPRKAAKRDVQVNLTFS